MASNLPKLRIVHFSDVYELRNLPKLQTLLARLKPSATAVVLGGDFLSPSPLSSLDGGKGMVATMRAIGVTHATLGNHEADLPLHVLQRRLQKLNQNACLINSNIQPAPNCPWFSTLLKPFDVIQTPCNRVKVALGGFLSDEQGIFRDNTFRGGRITPVDDALSKIYKESVVSGIADIMVPVTHQTIGRDIDVAQNLLNLQPGDALLLGGHEHSHFDETVRKREQSARIVKGVSDAEGVHVVDLTFDEVNGRFQIVDIQAELVEVPKYEASVVVQKLVDSHMSIIEELRNESVFDAGEFLPPGVSLSSEKSRYRQTTVGGVLCHAIKEELQADVAIINGATIKGNKTYSTSRISYAQLSKELPFPTKMVLVEMTRGQLQDVIFYSRTNPPTQEDGTEPERKGFMQVDLEFDRVGYHTGPQDAKLIVALPRNLMKGFCAIRPLIAIGERLEEDGKLNLKDDDFLPAIDLVVRHFSKERWYEMVQDCSFDQLDRDKKGFLSRDDVKNLITNAIGHEPPPFLVNDMMTAIDADENGVIDQGEFSHLLAQMEREHGVIKFD